MISYAMLANVSQESPPPTQRCARLAAAPALQEDQRPQWSCNGPPPSPPGHTRSPSPDIARAPGSGDSGRRSPGATGRRGRRRRAEAPALVSRFASELLAWTPVRSADEDSCESLRAHTRGRCRVDLRIPRLQVKNLIEANPHQSRFLVRESAVARATRGRDFARKNQ